MDRRVLLGHYIHFFLRQEIVEPVQLLFVTGNNFRREYYRVVWLEIQILMLTLREAGHGGSRLSLRACR